MDTTMKPHQRCATLMPGLCMYLCCCQLKPMYYHKKLVNRFDCISNCILNSILKSCIYSNLIQLTSSTLHQKIKVSTGVLGLCCDTFSSVWDIFFLFQAHLITECQAVSMPSRHKPKYMTSRI